MTEYHSYDPAHGHRLPHDPFNSIVGPRPIGWISSMGSDCSVNLAPYSFFNAFNYHPPILGFSSTSPKDSLRNVRETGEFVFNLVTREFADAMNATCAPAPYGTDEFALAGLAHLASTVVRPPRVAGAGAQFECKVTQIIPLRSHTGAATEGTLVLGEVVMAHIRTDLLHDGLFDTFAAGIVLRGGGPSAYASLGPEARFDMRRPS